VCTLCSCYPRAVLGYPPFWFKSSGYRARAVRDPRGVLAEWKTVLPEGTRIRVVDSTADYRWMVLPQRPAGTDGWSEGQPAGVVARHQPDEQRVKGLLLRAPGARHLVRREHARHARHLVGGADRGGRPEPACPPLR